MKIKEQAQKNKAMMEQQEQKSRITNDYSELILPRVLNKLLILRYADFFMYFYLIMVEKFIRIKKRVQITQ